MANPPIKPEEFYDCTGPGLWVCLCLINRGMHRQDITPCDEHKRTIGEYLEHQGLLFGYPINPSKYSDMQEHALYTVGFGNN